MSVSPLEGGVLQGARPLTPLQPVISGVLERIHAEFGTLLNTAASSNDADRKRHVLAYLHSSRQQLLRLVSLVQWHPKAKALQPCVKPRQVLDTSRRHAQLLEAAAVELYEAHVRRQPDFSPMFDVQTALDVLSTGVYNDLPACISDLGKAGLPPPEQQAHRLRHITHLVHSTLLKASLPGTCKVVSVARGAALLRAPGLYDARVTLVPAPELPREPLRKLADSADAAGPGPGPSGSAGHGLGAPLAGAQEPGVGKEGRGGDEEEEEEEEVSSGRPAGRWRWLLLGFTLHPLSALQGPALQDSQARGLLRDLNNRMHVAADAAVYALHRKRAAARAGTADGGGFLPHAPPDQPAPTPSASQRPSASVQVTVGGTSGPAQHVGGLAPGVHDRHVSMQRAFEADEVTSPLVAMHCVLSDVAGRVGVDAARRIAHRLVGQGGCWEGHATVAPATARLETGFSISFWNRAALLLPTPLPALSRAAGGGVTARQQRADTTGAAGRPVLEIGIAPDGVVMAVANTGFDQGSGDPPAPELDPLQDPPPASSSTLLPATPGLAQQAPASPGQQQAGPTAAAPAPGLGPTRTHDAVDGAVPVNTRALNVDELLLRAASAVAARELVLLRHLIRRELASPALQGTSWRVDLSWCCLRFQCLAGRPQRPPANVQHAVEAGGGGAPPAGRAAAVAHQARALQQAQATGLGAGPAAQHPSVQPALPKGISRAPGTSEGALPEGPYEVAIRFPALDFALGELRVMRVSRSLFTGRLLLQPGPGVGGDANLQSMTNWAQKEEALNEALQKAAQVPMGPAGAAAAAAGGGTGTAPGLPRVLREAAGRLVVQFREQQRNVVMATCMSAARQVKLHLGGPSARVNAFHALQPWADAKSYFTLWSLPPSPFPPNFPALYPSPPGAHPASVARGLSFVVGADHPSSPRGAYCLLVVACSGAMEALRVLKLLPVPRHVCVPQQRPAGANGQGGHDANMTPAPGARPPRTRDMPAELIAVVGWCRRQAAREKLLAQLNALDVALLETRAPAGPSPDPGCVSRIELLAFAGVSVPCRIARRAGAMPAYVGFTRVSLCTGHAPHDDESVLVEAHGTWFSSVPIPQRHASAGAACLDGDPASAPTRQGSPLVGVAQGEVHVLPGLRAQSSSCGLLDASGRGTAGVLRLTYSMSQGQSALDILADLLAVLRLQTFLARLEALALPPQQLLVMGRPQPAAPPHGVKREAGGEPDAGAGLPAAKRVAGLGVVHPPLIPGTPAWQGNGLAANGWPAGVKPEHAAQAPAGAAAAASGTPRWSWPHNAAVHVGSYDLAGATLITTPTPPPSVPPQAASRTLSWGEENGGVKSEWAHAPDAPPASQLAFHVSWAPRLPEAAEVWGPKGPAAAAGPAAQQATANTTAVKGGGGAHAASPSPRPPSSMAPPGQSGAARGAVSVSGSQANAASFARTSRELLASGTAAQPAAAATVGEVDVRRLARCAVRVHPGSGDEHHGGQASTRPLRASSPLAAEPADAFRGALQEMADAGEEGLLLDALAIAAQAMLGVDAALQAMSQQAARASGPAQQPRILHLPGHAPFQHTMHIPCHGPPSGARGASGVKPDPAVTLPTAPPPPSNVTLRVLCMAVGHCWLHVVVEPGGGPAAPAGPAFLAALLKMLRQELGEGGVYVAAAWSDLWSREAMPSGTSAAFAAGGPAAGHPPGRQPQLWVLVRTGQVQQAVHVALNACLAQ